MTKMWMAESLNLPKFKGAFLVRGDSPETAEVMGAEAAAIYINKLEEDKVTLLKALEKEHQVLEDISAWPEDWNQAWLKEAQSAIDATDALLSHIHSEGAEAKAGE